MESGGNRTDVQIIMDRKEEKEEGGGDENNETLLYNQMRRVIDHPLQL